MKDLSFCAGLCIIAPLFAPAKASFRPSREIEGITSKRPSVIFFRSPVSKPRSASAAMPHTESPDGQWIAYWRGGSALHSSPVFRSSSKTPKRTSCGVTGIGHALAHEIGHVLLRSCAHDNSGVIKGVWAKSDWQCVAVSILPCTKGQARVMRQMLQHIEARDAVRLPDQKNERRDVVVLARAADETVH
jgi:hypothetical protein